MIVTGSAPVRNGFQPFSFHEIDGWDEPSVSTPDDILEQKVKLVRKVVIADSLSFIEAPWDSRAAREAGEGRRDPHTSRHRRDGAEEVQPLGTPLSQADRLWSQDLFVYLD